MRNALNINNETPREIVCTGNKDNTWGGNDEASKYLEVGKIYHLTDIEVHSWHTRVWVAEFPGHWFNSVAFDDIG